MAVPKVDSDTSKYSWYAWSSPKSSYDIDVRVINMMIQMNRNFRTSPIIVMIILNMGPNILVSYSISRKRIQMKKDITTKKMLILKSESLP